MGSSGCLRLTSKCQMPILGAVLCFNPVHAQVMGPNDGYLCQYSNDTSIFWAEEGALELGACFRGSASPPRSIIPPVGLPFSLIVFCIPLSVPL